MQALLFVEVRRSSDCSYTGVIVYLGPRGALEGEICIDVQLYIEHSAMQYIGCQSCSIQSSIGLLFEYFRHVCNMCCK